MLSPSWKTLTTNCARLVIGCIDNFLQANTSFATCFEIYKIGALLHRGVYMASQIMLHTGRFVF